MKARFLISLLFYVFLFATTKAHEIHMSVANVDINKEENRIDYSVGVFYADLQAVVNHRYNTLIDFDKRIAMTSGDQNSILDYVLSTFKLLNSQGIPLKSDFLRWKIEDEMIWLFFCTESLPVSDTLVVENKLFFDVFDDQKNFVLFRQGKKEKGVEFTKRHPVFNYAIN